MDQKLLLKPVRKSVPRGSRLQKKYPFPIMRESLATSSATDDPKQDWKCFVGHLHAECITVSDEDSMHNLYNMGFFGKGTLSKRAPRFHTREEIESQDKDHGSSEDEGVPESKRKKLHHDDLLNIKVDPAVPPETNPVAESSVSSLGGEQEKLQLTFQEAFFLSYGLGCLVVMDNNKPLDLIKLWKKLCELSPDKNFPVLYTAYHHFRSKGWVVRSGLNYGVDYVLYKDGPHFYHSTYSVIVKAVKEKDLEETDNSGRFPLTWSFLSGLNRVNSHVAKAVMFACVVKPELMPEETLNSPVCVSRFKIQEILIKRWVPSSGK